MSQEGPLTLGRTGKACGVVCVRPAASRKELEQAYRLVYHCYLQRGYVHRDPFEIRLSIFNAFPGAITFVGTMAEEVISTVSLVPDTPVGLPMDEIFHHELQTLRANGRRLAEVTMLADRRAEFRRTLPMLLQLMKLVFDYATLVLKANDLCITINPRHAKFYKRYLLFEPMGGPKSYPSVRDNPALAERLNLDDAPAACNGHENLQKQFLENRTPIARFEDRYRMTCNDLHYFCIEVAPVLRSAQRTVLNHLRKVRSDCPWDAWGREIECSSAK